MPEDRADHRVMIETSPSVADRVGVAWIASQRGEKSIRARTTSRPPLPPPHPPPTPPGPCGFHMAVCHYPQTIRNAFALRGGVRLMLPRRCDRWQRLHGHSSRCSGSVTSNRTAPQQGCSHGQRPSHPSWGRGKGRSVRGRGDARCCRLTSSSLSDQLVAASRGARGKSVDAATSARSAWGGTHATIGIVVSSRSPR